MFRCLLRAEAFISGFPSKKVLLGEFHTFHNRNDMPYRLIRFLFVLIPLVSLTACTGMRGPDMGNGAETADASQPSNNPAVIALVDKARNDANTGQLPSATAALERALRIEPRNPVLWQELALLKLQKGDYRQAENFAARSNLWAGANKPLAAKNWRIISEARALRGDDKGAQAALSRARALESTGK